MVEVGREYIERGHPRRRTVIVAGHWGAGTRVAASADTPLRLGYVTVITIRTDGEEATRARPSFVRLDRFGQAFEAC